MGLVLSDMEGNLIDVNPAFADLIGYTTEEACRLSYWDITPGKYHKQEEAILEQLYTTGRYGPYDKESTSTKTAIVFRCASAAV